MYKTGMTSEEALGLFGKGLDCSQIVLGEFAEQYGMDKEAAYRIASGFGGGMWEGETCGAVTGSLMVLGLEYGHLENDPDSKQELMAKVMEFKEEFADEYGSCICREMLGHKIPEEFDLVIEEGLVGKICCNAVADACRIVCGMLNSR